MHHELRGEGSAVELDHRVAHVLDCIGHEQVPAVPELGPGASLGRIETNELELGTQAVPEGEVRLHDVAGPGGRREREALALGHCNGARRGDQMCAIPAPGTPGLLGRLDRRGEAGRVPCSAFVGGQLLSEVDAPADLHVLEVRGSLREGSHRRRRVLGQDQVLVREEVPQHGRALLLQKAGEPHQPRVVEHLLEDRIGLGDGRILAGEPLRPGIVGGVRPAPTVQVLGLQRHAASLEQERVLAGGVAHVLRNEPEATVVRAGVSEARADVIGVLEVREFRTLGPDRPGLHGVVALSHDAADVQVQDLTDVPNAMDVEVRRDRIDRDAGPLFREVHRPERRHEAPELEDVDDVVRAWEQERELAGTHPLSARDLRRAAQHDAADAPASDGT